MKNEMEDTVAPLERTAEIKRNEKRVYSIVIDERDKNIDSRVVLEKLMKQARRHSVKESKYSPKETTLGDSNNHIKWHDAPFVRKCCCPFEPCTCRSHLLKAEKLPKSTSDKNKLWLRRRKSPIRKPAGTLIPRLAAAVRAEIAACQQLEKSGELDALGPEFCCSNCPNFLKPTTDTSYYTHKGKLIAKYLRDNELEVTMQDLPKLQTVQEVQEQTNEIKEMVHKKDNVLNDKPHVLKKQIVPQKDKHKGSWTLGKYLKKFKIGNDKDVIKESMSSAITSKVKGYEQKKPVLKLEDSNGEKKLISLDKRIDNETADKDKPHTEEESEVKNETVENDKPLNEKQSELNSVRTDNDKLQTKEAPEVINETADNGKPLTGEETESQQVKKNLCPCGVYEIEDGKFTRIDDRQRKKGTHNTNVIPKPNYIDEHMKETEKEERSILFDIITEKTRSIHDSTGIVQRSDTNTRLSKLVIGEERISEKEIKSETDNTSIRSNTNASTKLHTIVFDEEYKSEKEIKTEQKIYSNSASDIIIQSNIECNNKLQTLVFDKERKSEEKLKPKEKENYVNTDNIRTQSHSNSNTKLSIKALDGERKSEKDSDKGEEQKQKIASTANINILSMTDAPVDVPTKKVVEEQGSSVLDEINENEHHNNSTRIINKTDTNAELTVFDEIMKTEEKSTGQNEYNRITDGQHTTSIADIASISQSEAYTKVLTGAESSDLSLNNNKNVTSKMKERLKEIGQALFPINEKNDDKKGPIGRLQHSMI